MSLNEEDVVDFNIVDGADGVDDMVGEGDRGGVTSMLSTLSHCQTSKPHHTPHHATPHTPFTISQTTSHNTIPKQKVALH